jgi:lipid-binding SYLF domain-containing protein
MKKIWLGVVVGGLAASPGMGATAFAQQNANGSGTATAANVNNRGDDLNDALEQVREANKLVAQMKADPGVISLLKQAKGVFLVPDYGSGSLIVGGAGGQGFLLARRNGTWSDPVFYDLGSVSLGLQAGAKAGQIAMILMSDKAVNQFKADNSFSLNANAGLTVVNYSARAQSSAGKGDIVVWSDVEGASAGVNVSATDISADESANQGFYNSTQATPAAIINGTVTADRPAAASLKASLPTT